MSAIRTLAASAALILVLGVGQAPGQVILSLGGNNPSFPQGYPATGYTTPYYSYSPAVPQATYPYAQPTAPRYAQTYPAYTTAPGYPATYNPGYYNGQQYGTGYYNPYQPTVGRSVDLGNGVRYYNSGYNGVYGQPGYNYGGVPGANYRNLQVGPVTISSPLR